MLLATQQDSQGRRYPNSLLRNWEAWSSLHPSVPPLLRGALGLPGSEEPKGVECPKCGRHYKLKSSLRNHQKWECGKEPQFQCPYCNYRAKQKMHVARHIERMHREKLDMLESIHDRSIKEDSSLYQQDTV
uniref:C2H2-type domain-containing protein n=1 Tax=Homalodisca liturata TaxID=320908 RepID=A0A1B6JGJ0_9HEMI